MAQIAAQNNTSIMKIRSFLGLNENPDGDTTLKNGEMAEMRNFRITQDHHLQVRPGSQMLMNLEDVIFGEDGAPADDRLYGVWHGTVGGRERTVAAYGGYLLDVDLAAGTARVRGVATADETSFFGFDEKVYLLNGHEYMSWDGEDYTQFTSVEGYIPLIQTATTPDGAGTLLENVNRLTVKRRVAFSPDGVADTFRLPEQDISAVHQVLLNGAAVSEYTVDLAEGSVKFGAVPEVGTNTMEVTYSKGSGSRGDVLGMRYSELFNGSTDTRVFLYGDGTNRAIYSGVEYESGQPSAEYFPDLYEVAIGESNTPVTALVRHYSRLMAYKPNSAWVIQYGSLTLDNDISTAAFYVQPINRQFGNEAPGQVKLLENNPLTLDVGGVYQWKSSNSGYIAGNENNAKRISDRVASTLSQFDIKRVKTVNSKFGHEYWFICDRAAVILNYANDTWYVYRDLPFDLLLEIEGKLFGFADGGKIVHFSRDYRSDDGAPIRCYAATGAMDFDRDWQLKYSPMLFLAMQPESNARISVSVETDRRSDYPEKIVAYSLATFNHVNFKHFSFGTSRKPQVKRLKMKVKKATFYRLIFASDSASATATVIEADVQLRYAGSVK